MEGKKDKNHHCPNCGGNEYSVEHPGGVDNMFLLCTGCGYKGAEKAWRLPKQTVAAVTSPIGDKTNRPSDKPKPENDPVKPNPKTKDKKNRMNSEKRLQPNDQENVRSVGAIASVREAGMPHEHLDETQMESLRYVVAEAIRTHIGNYPQFDADYDNADALADEVIAQVGQIDAETGANNIEWMLQNPTNPDVIYNGLRKIINPLLIERAKFHQGNKENKGLTSESRKMEDLKRASNPFVRTAIDKIVNSPLDSDMLMRYMMQTWGYPEEQAGDILDKVYEDFMRMGGGSQDDFVVALDKALTNRSPQNTIQPQEGLREVIMSNNPFAKKAKFITEEELLEAGKDSTVSMKTVEKNDGRKVSEVGKEASSNPFIRTAREFARSEWGEFMKGISEKNMTFPEETPSQKGDQEPQQSDGGYLDEDGGSVTKGKGKGKGSKSDTPANASPISTFDYNFVDRKEYRSSPQGRDLIPGQAEWEDEQVDKFYDGWVEDHIENSGGKVVGSNTERTMVLEDGDRALVPEYPREASYEKLLENRHNFQDDYTMMVAKDNLHLSKSARKVLDQIEFNEKTKNAYISKSALKVIQAIDCPDCGKKKTMSQKKKMGYRLHETLI